MVGWCRECGVSLYLKPPVTYDKGSLSEICVECYLAMIRDSPRLYLPLLSCPTCGNLCNETTWCHWCNSECCAACIEVSDHMAKITCNDPDDEYAAEEERKTMALDEHLKKSMAMFQALVLPKKRPKKTRRRMFFDD